MDWWPSRSLWRARDDEEGQWRDWRRRRESGSERKRGEEFGRDVMFGNVGSFKHFKNISIVIVAEDNDNTDLKITF